MQWACTTGQGFKTETQVWYSILPDGAWVMVQVIWSYTGCAFPSLRLPVSPNMGIKSECPVLERTSQGRR